MLFTLYYNNQQHEKYLIFAIINDRIYIFKTIFHIKKQSTHSATRKLLVKIMKKNVMQGQTKIGFKVYLIFIQLQCIYACIFIFMNVC